MLDAVTLFYILHFAAADPLESRVACLSRSVQSTTRLLIDHSAMPERSRLHRISKFLSQARWTSSARPLHTSSKTELVNAPLIKKQCTPGPSILPSQDEGTGQLP